MGRNKSWTNEEKEFLEERWGQMTLPGIAKKLGKSEDATKIMAGRMGLGDSRKNYDGFTLHYLAGLLNMDYKRIMNWVERYDFPAKEKVFVREKVWVVKENSFFKWAEANKEMIDFSKVEPNTFGAEPQWLKDKRNADLMKALKVKKANETPWSDNEDRILKGMLKAMCYTYGDIALRVGRTEGAVKSRIRSLRLKLRPIKAQVTYPEELTNNQTKSSRKPWTNEEDQIIKDICENKGTIIDIAKALESDRSFSAVKNRVRKLGMKPHPLDEYRDEHVALIIELVGKGYSMGDIAERIGKTALGVRGKLERMGYHFKNGVPIPPQSEKINAV